MANLTVDSLAWAANAADFQKRWLYCDGTVSATGGRRGGRCYEGNAFNALRRVFPAISGAVAVVGVARYGGLDVAILTIQDVGESQVTLYVNADGALQVKRGVTVLGASASGLILSNNYYYLELKVTIDPSAGTVDVQLNGSPVAGLTGLTGLNTRATANTSWSGLALQAGLFCDLYVNDGSGDAPDNGFWGDTRVDPHYPVSDGPTNDWTPSTGVNHYALLDEATPNDDTDYISTNSLNAIDLVKVQDLINAGGTIRSCELLVLAAKTDAGASAIKPVWRPDSTNYLGSEFLPSDGSYAYAAFLAALNPETSAPWEESEFNAGRVGVKKTV